jgi:hypothetical protein
MYLRNEAIKTYGGVEIKQHAFIILILDDTEYPLSFSGFFIPTVTNLNIEQYFKHKLKSFMRSIF